MYAEGRGGLPKDDAQAVIWFHKAADAGSSTGMMDLGSMYEYGRGLPKDYAQAALWYRKAADAGNEQAQLALKRLASEQHDPLN
jgi:uncharacterized protein